MILNNELSCAHQAPKIFCSSQTNITFQTFSDCRLPTADCRLPTHTDDDDATSITPPASRTFLAAAAPRTNRSPILFFTQLWKSFRWLKILFCFCVHESDEIEMEMGHVTINSPGSKYVAWVVLEKFLTECNFPCLCDRRHTTSASTMTDFTFQNQAERSRETKARHRRRRGRQRMKSHGTCSPRIVTRHHRASLRPT